MDKHEDTNSRVTFFSSALSLVVLLFTGGLVFLFLRAKPALFAQCLVPTEEWQSWYEDTAGRQTLLPAILALLAVFLATLVVARRAAVGASIAALVAALALFAKVRPSPVRGNGFALDFVQHATDLTPLDGRFTAYRWLGPWLSYHLGFKGCLGWYLFLLAAYFVGTIWIYAAVKSRTRDPVWAVLLALVPALSTTGWYGVYDPGYSDWLLFMALIGALFARRNWQSLQLACFALWIHERGIFVAPCLVIFRMLLFPDRPRREWIRYAGGILVGAAFYFSARRLGAHPTQAGVGFYLSQLGHGSYFHLDQPLTAKLLFSSAVEDYKALWFIPIVFLATSKRLILATFPFIAAQVLVAIDTVRLLDLLVFPMLVCALVLYEQFPARRNLLKATLIAALVVNFLTPIHYLSQNWSFRADTRFNLY